MLLVKRVALVAACFAFLPGTLLAQSDNGAVETVVVTGTRIPRPESDMPNPVQTLTAQDIQHSGTVNLTDYLKRIPALTGSLGDFQTTGYNTLEANDGASLGGINLLDLRNLGYIRTLVLEDGHRIVGSSTGSTAVDTDSIPITLLDRVDVVTGGSSAVYGADGVSGVVNFIMKHNLEGVDARVQAGTSQDGGGSKYIAAASVGHNFDNGNGNVTFTYEGSYQDRLNFSQRDFTSQGGATFFIPNPDNVRGKKPNLPANIPTTNAQFIYSAPTGAIDPTLVGYPTMLGNGDKFNLGTVLPGGIAINSSGMPFAQDLTGDVLPTEHRSIAQVQADDEFSRWFKLSAEFRFAHVDTKSESTAPFDDDVPITSQNAFLPANVIAKIVANGSAGQGPQGSALGILSEDYLAIRNAEKVSRDLYRGVLDAQGDLPLPEFLHDAKYDISYVYGQTDIDDVDEHNRITDRFMAAMDSVIDPATGAATCRSNLYPGVRPPDLSAKAFVKNEFYGPGNNYFSDTTSTYPTSQYATTFAPGPNSGCVPFDPFGNAATNAASIRWMTANTDTAGLLHEQDLNGFMSFNLPQVQDWGFAKPISFVFGGEWREEVSKSTPDPLTEIQGLYWAGGILPERGEFSVSEAYGEASVPLLADKPFVKELTFDFAGRVSDYSTAGTDETWKADFVYSPISGIKFRGTDALAVRAPNIGELFAPNQLGYTYVDDPCDTRFIKQGTQYRATNCKTLLDNLLGPGGYNQVKNNLEPDQTIPAYTEGNSALQPETARTLTLGAVIQPDFLPDLVMTVDWYRINIADAITPPSTQSVADQCVDLSTLNNPFCAEITRATTGKFVGQISQVTSQELNLASYFTQGEDFTISYHANLDDWFGSHVGALDLHLMGNHTDMISFVALPGEAAVNSMNLATGGADFGPTPYWHLNLDAVWTHDAWTLDYNVDWFNSVYNPYITERSQPVGQPNILAHQYLYAPAYDVHSIQLGYDIREGWNVYAGVNNLWYQKPSIGNTGYPVDPLGRFFYGGVKIDLNP